MIRLAEDDDLRRQMSAAALKRSASNYYDWDSKSERMLEIFGEVIEWAAREAKRPLQLLERRGAARDHPSLVGVPETEYLKAWFLIAPA